MGDKQPGLLSSADATVLPYSANGKNRLKSPNTMIPETWIRVLKCDEDGLTPTEIARETGIGLSNVANIKKRLSELGYRIGRFRAKRGKLPPQELQPWRPEDELPDDDEPPCTDRSFCRCGATLPCNRCLTDYRLASSRPGVDASCLCTETATCDGCRLTKSRDKQRETLGKRRSAKSSKAIPDHQATTSRR